MTRLSYSGILTETALCAALVAGISLNAVYAAPPAKRAASPTAQSTKETKMNDEDPFEIRLSGNGPELKAMLVNRSSVPRSALCDGELQPSRLEIVSSTGKRVKAFDSRSIMKYDNTVHCRLFKSVQPGRDLEMGVVKFKKSGEGFEASWGPYRFETVPAGEYKARVIWTSEFDTCFDEETEQQRKLANVWLGRIQSNEVTLLLR